MILACTHRVALRRSISRALAISLFFVTSIVHGQAPAPSQPPLYGGAAASAPPQQQGGSATAGVFAPVLDSENRPITAGGFVKDGPVIFEDISAKSGLNTWIHKMGTPQKAYILETIGSGVALLDYDHDGWLDIYLVNGSTFDAENGKSEAPRAALFRIRRREVEDVSQPKHATVSRS